MRSILAALLLTGSLLSTASGVESPPVLPPVDQTAEFAVEVVLSGLDHPLGLTVRPTASKQGPYELFVAESGAGRILRLQTASQSEPKEVLSGFSLASPEWLDLKPIGPTTLGFLTRSKLIVCDSGRGPGEDLVAVYTITDNGTARGVSKPDHTVGPVTDGDSTPAESLLLGFAMNDRIAYFGAANSLGEGMIFKAGREANQLSFLQPYYSDRRLPRKGPLLAITLTPHARPEFLVVGEMGSTDTQGDSWLTFLVPASGDVALGLPLGLDDVIALAYSPTGQLYAIDFAADGQREGGVYRIDDARREGRQTCQPVRVAALDRPTALVFTPDGTLYIAMLGPEGDEPSGAVVRITGEF